MEAGGNSSAVSLSAIIDDDTSSEERKAGSLCLYGERTQAWPASARLTCHLCLEISSACLHAFDTVSPSVSYTSHVWRNTTSLNRESCLMAMTSFLGYIELCLHCSPSWLALLCSPIITMQLCLSWRLFISDLWLFPSEQSGVISKAKWRKRHGMAIMDGMKYQWKLCAHGLMAKKWLANNGVMAYEIWRISKAISNGINIENNNNQCINEISITWQCVWLASASAWPGWPGLAYVAMECRNEEEEEEENQSRRKASIEEEDVKRKWRNEIISKRKWRRQKWRSENENEMKSK